MADVYHERAAAEPGAVDPFRRQILHLADHRSLDALASAEELRRPLFNSSGKAFREVTGKLGRNRIWPPPSLVTKAKLEQPNGSRPFIVYSQKICRHTPHQQ